ncbi:hypothetical protein [Burkholderia glumae]|uniref:hypothetical protein n=1 Tax=Burkholderia glumae TaxID=337 RepID=UPI00031C5CFC|nr:hypothetical protein [Burkholderia glumae]PJO24860.1 hypothetical protein Y5A_000145 [Burkholderia glumae AU6208]QHE11824.1 hypothetical protein GQR88_16380 [Burkholderia glumae AU6208]
MNDKELLELAAKAAGIIVDGFEDAPWLEIRYGYTCAISCPSGYWNPLEDDGDALRLAVKLRLDIMPGHNFQEASNRDDTAASQEPDGDDPCAALRRAITRAAAEIARTTDTGGEA